MYAALRDAGYQRHEAIVFVNDGLERFTQWRDGKKQFLTANRAWAIDAHLTMGTYTDMPAMWAIFYVGWVRARLVRCVPGR